jgi:hypothetical protein
VFDRFDLAALAQPHPNFFCFLWFAERQAPLLSSLARLGELHVNGAKVDGVCYKYSVVSRFMLDLPCVIRQPAGWCREAFQSPDLNCLVLYQADTLMPIQVSRVSTLEPFVVIVFVL